MFLSVVFVTHGDRLETVKRLVDSIAAHAEDKWVEFLCVDNGSNPSASSYISRRYPFIRTVRHAENLGTSRAFNAGLRIAGGEYVMIINDDTVVPAGMLEKLGEHIRAHPGHDGIALGLKRSESEYQALRLRIVNTSKSHPKKRVRATFIGTGNLVIKRSVIEKVGFYDEQYFAGNEDMDLSLRLKRSGARIYYYPDFFIYHIHVYRGRKTDWPDFILARRLSDVYYAQKFYPLFVPLARLYAARNFKKRFFGKIDRDTYDMARRILSLKRSSYYEIQKSLVGNGIRAAHELYFHRTG